jgi:hypothetical protein
MRRWRLLWCAVLTALLPAPCGAQIADVLLAQGIRRSPSPEAEPAPTPSPPPAAADVPSAEPAPPPPAEEPLGFAGRSLTPGPTATSPDFVPILDRWRIGMPNWNRFDRAVDSPFARGRWWDPYNQNVLKSDYPIFGQDIFLNVSAILDTVVNFRSIPTPSNVSAARAGAFDFFGRGDQIFFSSYAIASIELFKGDSAFRPRDWEFRITPVFNVNYLSAEENGVVNIDVRRGTTRLDEYISLQELLVEYHLADLSPNYDFISTRAGIQLFQSDFRGFIFSDSQLGARLFGNFDANRYQFNAAYFRPLEKDTNSGLNRLFDFRGQNLFIANLFRQDLIWPGYTAMVNLHYLNDAGDTHFDRNGFLTRPAPIGTLAPKVVNAVWLGWNGDGHIGPLNITHAFYQVLGGQDDDPIGGQGQRLSAQMAAIELSMDFDWVRPKLSFFWSSGDPTPNDGVARGFDTIFDNPNFAGNGFSYWVRNGLPLTSTGLSLKGPFSLVPDLRSSKIEGQPNFINPGLFLLNFGVDLDLTPTLKSFINVNLLRFQTTKVLENLLFQSKIGHNIGIDYSVGMRWRPFLNDNVIISAGLAALQVGSGFQDLYSNTSFTFGANGLQRTTNSFPGGLLYSAFLAFTLTY